MVHVKRLVMHGFKSFVKKTELPFTPEINVVLGPNGSGKSNITDALCFVLGRLSIKSMRAAKAKNLIFLGSKIAAPAKEAVVEIVFENADRIFSIDKDEVSIKRIVRKNGQSIYKIDNQTKTRQEVLALLAQAGIDPNGFNIILQGEIQNFVRMHTEERRKIIEEVSGISIYEIRKEKSLKELDKTEEKLKEIGAILRERTAYLNNLEKERQQALRFKKLEKDVEKLKASIISSGLRTNKKEVDKVVLEITKKEREIIRVKKIITMFEAEIRDFKLKIVHINSTIQESTGLEQEKLNKEITNLRAELAGMNVNLENFESKLIQVLKQKQELQKVIEENESSIKELQKASGGKKAKLKQTIKQKDLEAKEQELEELEEERKKFYMVKSELKSIRERVQEKENALQNYSNESEFLVKQIKSLARELFDKTTSQQRVNTLKTSLLERKELLEGLKKRETELEKISYANEYEIDKQGKLIGKISQMDICPLCKSKITEGHIESIHKEIKPQVDALNRQISESDKELGEIYTKKKVLEEAIEQINEEILKRELDLVKLFNINEKDVQIKALQDKKEVSRKELAELSKKKSLLEKEFNENTDIDQRYETVRIELQEISIRSDKNLDSEVSFKKRELGRSKISFKQFLREEKDLKEELEELKGKLKEKKNLLEGKKKQEEDLSKKFQKLILNRDNFQRKIREKEIEQTKKQNIIYNIEQGINNLKIEKARFDAIVENLEDELTQFKGVEIIKASKDTLIPRLAKTQDILSRIGTVNLRSLEVYDQVKQEYNIIQEKVEVITKEKEGVLKIIHEIDIKKKKAFLKTLNALNEAFSRNFSQLSTKGQVSLELENKKDPFEAGVNIIVKTGHGKYFDVTSLSGGEQTIVALSLIFAIQELNPYCFYVLDEIDAALDKRNSERLASLLRKYMKKGQYIIITHNDEIITNADTLYGISMHDGISKIISLKV